MTSPWIVIPARGGSRGVPRKNLRPLVGKPLIYYTIQTALAATTPERVIVITDDDELDEVSTHFGAQVIRESESASGQATLDQLIIRHLGDLFTLGANKNDLLLTLQPTCPLITPERILEAVEVLQAGAGAVITVKDDRHLTWVIKDGVPVPGYQARVNRQLLPTQFRESGAIIGARIEDVQKHQTRIIEPISLIELAESESLDIDTFSDLVVAEHWLTRKKILIHTNASTKMGMGHLYRSLALAQELARHQVLIVTTKAKELGKKFFSDQVFEHAEIGSASELAAKARAFEADLVVLDVLDTEKDLVEGLQLAGAKVVTFEDLGSGAEAADLTVSDLYPNPKLGQNQLTGVGSAILAPNFEVLTRFAVIEENVNHVLVLFGGTDPSHLAEKSLRALEALEFKGRVTCVRGLGASEIAGSFELDLETLSDVKNMPALMATADIALSSAGRTITELMSIGVPTICLAQNAKELTHEHATKQNGILNLGLGSDVTAAEIGQSIAALLADFDERKKMHAASLAATKTRTNAKVVGEILKRIGF